MECWGVAKGSTTFYVNFPKTRVSFWWVGRATCWLGCLFLSFLLLSKIPCGILESGEEVEGRLWENLGWNVASIERLSLFLPYLHSRKPGVSAFGDLVWPKGHMSVGCSPLSGSGSQPLESQTCLSLLNAFFQILVLL